LCWRAPSPITPLLTMGATGIDRMLSRRELRVEGREAS